MPTTSPGKHATRRGFYVLYHDFELDENDPLFAELEALPDQVFGELRLPPGNAIVQVFLFDTQERVRARTCGRSTATCRNLPPGVLHRRAAVGGGADELKIFTWMGDHLRTDLRHELTHALLHSVLKDVPLWLDEGLAGYFELPPRTDGVNPQHLDTLRARAVPARPRPAGEAHAGGADGEAGVPRGVGVGPPDAPQRPRRRRKCCTSTCRRCAPNANPGPLLPRLREAVPDPEQALVDHLAATEMPKPRARSRAAGPK